MNFHEVFVPSLATNACWCELGFFDYVVMIYYLNFSFS
jgi:hypothetical protein